MNDAATASDAPVPFPTTQERDELILEFQRLAARLTRVGILSRTSSSRLMRSMNQQRRQAEDKRHAFPELLLAIVLGIADGTLKAGSDFVHGDNGLVALHLESIANTLHRTQRGSWPARTMRSLFHFGWMHFREVVNARSARMQFGPEEDRRRTVIIHVPSANDFVGSRPAPVPAR